MKKKVLSVILVVALVLCACGNQKGEVTESGTAETEVLASVPEKTEEPKESLKPSTEPAAATPAATVSAAPTETPKATKAPAVTETPKASNTPVATEKPKASKEPAKETGSSVTEKPKSTSTPQPTEAAQSSDSGKSNSNQVESTEPTPVPTPAPTQKPVQTPEPTPAPTPEPTVAPCNHNFEKRYGFGEGEPTCSTGSSWYMICTICGEIGDEGFDPATGHTPVSTEIYHGNCVEDTIIETTCSVCGAYLGREGHTEDEHDWITETITEPYWNEETHQVEEISKEVTYCSRCGTPQ